MKHRNAISSILFHLLLGRSRRADPHTVEKAIAMSRTMVEDRCRFLGRGVGEDAQFLRDRVVLHLSIGASVGGLFLLLLAGYAIAGVCDSVWPLVLHGCAVALLGGVLILLRRTDPTPGVVRLLEAVGLLGSFILYAFMAAASPSEWFSSESLVLIYCMALIGRSVFTPSTGLHTALLAAAAAVPLLAVTIHHAYAVQSAAWDSLLLTVAWYLASGGLAVAVSRVTFGLRKGMQAAMKLGQYTLEEKIGQGGMGRVYRARHAMLRRETAVKIMSQPADDGRSARRFEREVQLTARLTHPNTITVFDYGQTSEGLFYYAMELIDGQNLEDIVEATGPMAPARVVHVMQQAASALREAHQLGLIHRDVKPTNIMLARIGGRDDVVKVLDFGLVRELSQGAVGRSELTTVVGTPDYMAPEVISEPETVDARSDIYALGAVGYYLLTGHRLFDADSPIEICAHQLHSRPIPVEELAPEIVPFALAALVEACLDKDPQKRPRDAAAVLTQLASVGVERWTDEEATLWWRRYDRAFASDTVPAESGTIATVEESEQEIASALTLPGAGVPVQY